MGIALWLAYQGQDNGLAKYWLKIVKETWICELSPLNNWNTADTVTSINQSITQLSWIKITPRKKAFENIVGKGENAGYQPNI